MSYFRSQTNSVALAEFSEAEEKISTEAHNDELQDFNDNIEVPEDELKSSQKTEFLSNERTGALERESPKLDRVNMDRNLSPTESQLEDIDIEQCDFTSEQSKVSPEDELIELLKSGAIDVSSPEYSRDSFDVAEEDRHKSLETDVQSYPEEEEIHSSVELDAFAGNKAETKSDAESDSSDDVIERFEASLRPEERPNYMNNVGNNLEAYGNLHGDDQDSTTSDEGDAPEHVELEDNALSESSANIEKVVARLGEIENELSESEEGGLGTRESERKSSDVEFEEIERLLYEEKALIEAEEKSKRLAHEPADNSSDEEFERLEKALYEQKARGEAAENLNDMSPEEFMKTASDEEFEQLEKMAREEKAANQTQPDEFVTKDDELDSLRGDIENQAVDSKPLSSLPILPVSSRKTEEDDDLLDIIGTSDSDISDSSEDLEEVQKLIVAQASSDDRETLGSDVEEKNPVMYSVSLRTSAPAPPVTAPVASEHNVAFVSM